MSASADHPVWQRLRWRFRNRMRSRAATNASFLSISMSEQPEAEEQTPEDADSSEFAAFILDPTRYDHIRRDHRVIGWFILIQILILSILILVAQPEIHSTQTMVTDAATKILSGNDTSGIALVDEPFSTPIQTTSPCMTKACIKAGKDYRADSDSTIDPCEDFYAYACNGWIDRNVLSPGKGRLTRFDVLHAENQLVLKEILQGTDPPNRQEGLSDDEYKLDVSNLESCRSMYKACMDVDALYVLGMKPIVPIVEMATSFNASVTDVDAPNVLAEVLAKLALKSVNGLIDTTVNVDSKAPVRNVLELHQSGLTFTELEAYTRNGILEQLAPKIAELFQRYERSRDGKDVDEARKVELEALANNVAQFEAELSQIQVGDDKFVDPEATYNPYHLSFAVQDIPSLNLTRYLNVLVSDKTSNIKFRFENNTKIVVPVPAYLNLLNKLISKTPRKTLQYYLQWKVIVSFGPVLDIATQKLVQDTTGIPSGTKGTIDTSKRWETCVGTVENSVNSLIMRYYAQKAFPGESKTRALEVADAIVDAFRDGAMEVDWLDETTRKSVIAKLDLVKKKVGFPEQPNITSPINLIEYYQGLMINTTSHFNNTLAWRTWESQRILRKLDSLSTGFEDWDMSALSANAFYSRTSNEVVFPAGILRSPYFDKDLPSYANFAAIGMFMGHELSV